MRDNQVLALQAEAMQRGQDARLMPLVLETMATAGVDFPTLDRIAATTGPGSFTGIRIGLAAARGIGLAAGKPVIGIDRFRIYRTFAAASLMIILESRRAELFVQIDRDAPQMWTKNQIADYLTAHPDTHLTGDCAALFPNSFHTSLSCPEVQLCAALATQVDATDPAFIPRPYYLRAPDVTLAKA